MISYNILHVVTGLNNGGAEAVLCRLASFDQAAGNKHHVISLMDRGVYADRLERAGVSVYTLNFPRGKISAKGLLKLHRLIRSIQPDVLQTWMYHSDLIGGLVGRLSGVRAIAWGIRHANFDAAHNSRTTMLLMRICARLSSWLPCKIVSCSTEATRMHQAAGYNADKFVDIPNGYDLQNLRPDSNAGSAVRAELGIGANEFVLGMVARFDAQKDHANLVHALSQIKQRGIPFICLLVGNGMDASNNVLRNWLDTAGIADQVRLLGPRSDITAVMNALDIHVLSSLGEAFPNVLAEAMACGTPCVTTDVGDAALIVGEHGWVVLQQDAGALANGLVEAYKSFQAGGNTWEARQVACRKHIMENFELALMCERYRQVWLGCMH